MVEFQGQTTASSDVEYPGTTIPTIFADGIANFANSAHIVKFYLFRFDPNMKTANKAQIMPCAQAVFSLDGFINAFAFLESAVEKLRVQGLITDEMLATARKIPQG
jgi:hypothetical protein